MLTRLQVDGFKNLDRIDVRLGPFTCVAGPNGVGKSNLFDAISFLATLADKPLVEAASTVRGGDSRRGDVWSLFRRAGGRVAETMEFAAEFLISTEGEDELGQAAEASMTFLRYELELRHREDSTIRTMGALEIARERMVHIRKSEARSRLGFPHKKAWRDGSPVRTGDLRLPPSHRWERLPDPKKVLHDALRAANGATGRRAKSFRPKRAAHRLADLITDWRPLRSLAAFNRLEAETRSALDRLGLQTIGAD